MAAKFVSAAEAELACGVCFQFFVKPHEPKNLPKCSHIMCQICLQKMSEGGLKTVTCPQCNKISPLPEEGVEGLTTSLIARNLAERHPRGITQHKEYMQSQLHCGLEENANKVTKLKEMIEQTQNAIRTEEEEINKAVEVVMIKAQELLKQLRNTSGLDRLQEQLAKLEIKIKHIETAQSKLKTMTDEEFHAQIDAITNQTEKLIIGEVKESTTAFCIGTFIANIQLGRIVKPRQLELVQEFGEYQSASDVTSDSNGVLAVCDWKIKPQQVSVFQKDGTEYKQQSKFSVLPGSRVRPLDMVLSGGKYLVTKFAAGFDVYSADGNFQKTESVKDKQSEHEEMDVQSISICSTKDGKILIGSIVQAEGVETGKGVVTVHDKGGSLMKTIPIGILPKRITGINETHVAACDCPGNNVCVYNLHTGQETLNIVVQKPIGIYYDEQSDCILIGRFTETDVYGIAVAGSGVIEQYCWVSGKLLACLAHRLYKPRGLTFTEDNMLVVTDGNSVKLYKID